MTWFNELDPYAAAWLGQLWPAATVDTRSICDLSAADILGRRRAHFFAGIGGWEYALALAGWPSDLPIWTGSCPCQPFSAAGKQKGETDARHLWPEFRRLIAECRPPIVVGEQVASRLGRDWLAGVRADLEGLGYAVGAADLCAAGVGAPHLRQRLYWGAVRLDNADRDRAQRAGAGERPAGPDGAWAQSLWLPCLDGKLRRVPARWVADTEGAGRWPDTRTVRGSAGEGIRATERQDGGWSGQQAGRVGHSRAVDGREPPESLAQSGVLPLADGLSGPMGRLCPDPDTFPLAVGAVNRVGRLRAYGNAIVPQVAATFVRAFMESVGIEPAGLAHAEGEG